MSFGETESAMFRLTKPHSDNLLSSPEHGMGYQFVEVVTGAWAVREGPEFVIEGLSLAKGEHWRKGIVLNAELLILDDELRKGLPGGSYKQLLALAVKSEDVVRAIRAAGFPQEQQALAQLREDAVSYGKKTKRAADAPSELTAANEIFKRFTAFENDRRITAAGGLLPGTYATTEADATNVRTGLEAVARYALPTPKPAIYVFTVKPLKDAAIRRGIVQSAFGQPGGGVEVLFCDGTAANTVTGPGKIPER
jgi:hypothetical protein